MICWHCEANIRKIRYLVPQSESPWRGSALIVCSKCKNKYNNVIDVRK